jgi:hypothetical protein
VLFVDVWKTQQKGHLMNNIASSVIKMVALVGGAVLGTVLSCWLDRILTEQAEARSEHDKMRYAQGLTPIPRKENE